MLNCLKKLFIFPTRMGRVNFINLKGFYSILLFLTLCFSYKLGWLVAVVLVLYLVATIRVNNARLHDFNSSGWWNILYFIPVINIFFFLQLVGLSGTSKENKYGLPPASTNFIQKILACISMVIIIANAIFSLILGSRL